MTGHFQKLCAEHLVGKKSVHFVRPHRKQHTPTYVSCYVQNSYSHTENIVCTSLNICCTCIVIHANGCASILGVTEYQENNVRQNVPGFDVIALLTGLETSRKQQWWCGWATYCTE